MELAQIRVQPHILAQEEHRVAAVTTAITTLQSIRTHLAHLLNMEDRLHMVVRILPQGMKKARVLLQGILRLPHPTPMILTTETPGQVVMDLHLRTTRVGIHQREVIRIVWALNPLRLMEGILYYTMTRFPPRVGQNLALNMDRVVLRTVVHLTNQSQVPLPKLPLLLE